MEESGMSANSGVRGWVEEANEGCDREHLGAKLDQAVSGGTLPAQLDNSGL
jgi:hypothetical protein